MNSITGAFIFIIVCIVLLESSVVSTAIQIVKSNKKLSKCYEKYLEKNGEISEKMKDTVELHKKFHHQQVKDSIFIIVCTSVLLIVIPFFIILFFISK